MGLSFDTLGYSGGCSGRLQAFRASKQFSGEHGSLARDMAIADLGPLLRRSASLFDPPGLIHRFFGGGAGLTP